MRMALAIALKDLRSLLRQPAALVMIIVTPSPWPRCSASPSAGPPSSRSMPLRSPSRARTGGVSRGAPAAGELLAGVLRGVERSGLVELASAPSAAAARAAVDRGDADVAVIVPPDLSAAVYGAAKRAESRVELYENPTKQIGGALVEGVVGNVLLEFNGARAAVAGALALRERGDPQSAAVARRAVLSYRQTAANSVPQQREPRLSGADEAESVSLAGNILVGMMIVFMFFCAGNSARTILDEDRDGTLARLFTTPASPRVVLLGKYLSVYLTTLLQAVVLLLAGRVLFGMHWGSAGAVVALVLVGVGAASGVALLVTAFARTPVQAGVIGSGVYLLLALLGGNFAGPAAPNSAFALVQKFTPNGWLAEGWYTVTRGGGVGDVLPALAVVLGVAVVCCAVAVLRLRRRFT